jgi:hypothetical protein
MGNVSNVFQKLREQKRRKNNQGEIKDRAKRGTQTKKARREETRKLT